VQVGAGDQRTFDLYYPLPAGREHAAEIPQYDLVWSVRTPARVVAERTPFERTEVEAYAGAAPIHGPSVGWGPIWWYDPLYPSVTFAHPVIIHHAHPRIVTRPYLGPRHVWIARPPVRRF